MPSNIAEPLRSLARPIDSLSLLPGNPRRGDVAAVARSYEKFGQRKPIVATPDGTVIAGNHQLEAARLLGWDEIAVVIVDDDEMTAKAFALADNRTSDLGHYDDEALVALLASVATDPDLLAATSFSAAELEALSFLAQPPTLEEVAAAMSDDDAAEDIRKVTLILPVDLADALLSHLKTIGSHKAAVEAWLNL